MLVRPNLNDFKVIGYYLGTIILGIGFATIIPLLTGLIFGEIEPAVDYFISGSLLLSMGFILRILNRKRADLDWIHGMTIVALSWIIASLSAALPLFLSGHYGSYLDAVFEACSGLTTSGLSLTQELDHMSMAHNMWRHLLQYIGGQGMVVVALSFMVSRLSGAFKMYVGEGREEKILPNVIHTSRFIWLVSFVYMLIGTIAMTICIAKSGIPLLKAIFHSLFLFMAGWDTGGFGAQSQNILYYHNPALEIVILFIIILGTLNFKLHFAVFNGNPQEIRKNIELNVFFFSVLLTFSAILTNLIPQGIYSNITSLFRKGFFHLISAHTGTGYMTIYPQQFIQEWGSLALAGLIISMSIGGSICSTTGGIKTMRIGVILKALYQDVKKMLLPDTAVISAKFHHIQEIFINDSMVRSALLTTLLYIILFFIGSIIGMLYGYPFLDSTFESVSAGANVGLSCGITNPSMPTGLKITYILQMWIGRLEFMSIFTLVAFIWSILKGR